MSIVLQAVEILQETRIRLVFTNSLAGGAFGAPPPSFYAVTNRDGRALSPTIQAALIVPGNPNVVELVLGSPIAKSVLYEATAIGVPATDASVTASGAGLNLRWGITQPRQDLEPLQHARERVLYFVDLMFNGMDFEESATGDLGQIEGTPNVTKALNRGVEADNLPWDETYGGKARQFVDSPSPTAGTLKGSISAQILRDPRVKSNRMTYETDDEKTYLYATPTLISGAPLERVSVEVPSE